MGRAGSALPVGPSGSLALTWGDGATSVQERLDFSIVVRAVDAAGNAGPASAPVRIHHAGLTAEQAAQRDAAGMSNCSAATSAGGRGAPMLAYAGLALLGLAAVRSRGRGASRRRDP